MQFSSITIDPFWTSHHPSCHRKSHDMSKLHPSPLSANSESALSSHSPIHTITQKVDNNFASKPYHSRKAHNKSRGGCDACKKRRKKCDQSQPRCGLCLSHNSPCHYASSEKGSLTPRTPPTQPLPLTISHKNGLPNSNPSELELLTHFHHHTLPTLGSSTVQKAILGYIPTAFTHTYLHHAILTLSAAHLSTLLPTPHHTFTKHQYQHASSAFSTFRSQLALPFTASHFDTIILTCILLNVTTFSSSTRYPSSESWLFSSPSRPGESGQWLSVQGGLRSLLFQGRAFLASSPWARVMEQEAGTFPPENSNAFAHSQNLPPSVPSSFPTLFSISSSSTNENNTYYAPFGMLIYLLSIPSSEIRLTQWIAFINRLGPEFLQLLKCRDERALLILAYWLALMCEVNIWWVENRVRSECSACCRWLDVSGSEGLREFLAYPARCCGYVLGSDQGMLVRLAEGGGDVEF